MNVPTWFTTRLKDTDPNLVVYFNPFRQRWTIDRKVEGQANTNVMVVQTEDKQFLELSDNIIDRVRSMDAWQKHGSYEAYHRHNIQMEVAEKEKRDAAIREGYRLAAIDDKRQMNEAFTLVQRHDVARPHK